MNRFSICLFIGAFSPLLVVAGGCAKAGPGATLDVTGDALVRAQVRREIAHENVVRAQAQTVGEVRGRLHVAGDALVSQEKDLVEARASNETAKKQFLEMEQEHAKLRAKWYVTWGRRIEWAIALIAGAYAAMIALRVLGLFVGGPVGATSAMISTAFGGVLPGSGWIQGLFDNLWFRRFRQAQIGAKP